MSLCTSVLTHSAPYCRRSSDLSDIQTDLGGQNQIFGRLPEKHLILMTTPIHRVIISVNRGDNISLVIIITTCGQKGHFSQAGRPWITAHRLSLRSNTTFVRVCGQCGSQNPARRLLQLTFTSLREDFWTNNKRSGVLFKAGLFLWGHFTLCCKNHRMWLIRLLV